MKGVTGTTRKDKKGNVIRDADGNEVLYWYARIDGKKVYIGKGEEGRELAEVARQRYEQDLQLAKMDSLPFNEQALHYREQIKQERKFRNIKELANWYMALSVVQKKKSYTRETQALKHLLPHFGKMSPAGLKGSDTVKYRDRRTKQGANDNTIDYELAVLRQIYRTALKLDEITADYLPGSFVMNGTTNPRPIITDEQFELLHKNAKPVFADILLCGWETAMRSGEIAKLRAKDIHLDVAVDTDGNSVSYIYLGIFDTKTGAERVVPVSDTLKEMLQRRLEGLNPNDRVFTREDGKHFTTNSFSDRMRTLCRQLDIPYGDKLLDKRGNRIGIVFHCLRHTRTSKWVEMGFSDEIIRKATGHMSLDAYRNYVRLKPSVVMRLVKTQNRTNRDKPKLEKTIFL
jgi:integrase